MDSSAAVPTRMAPWRSTPRRASSPLRCIRASSAGSACSVRWLMSATSSISVPYWGTSSRYISDMALENRARISSEGTKVWAGVEDMVLVGTEVGATGQPCGRVDSWHAC